MAARLWQPTSVAQDCSWLGIKQPAKWVEVFMPNVLLNDRLSIQWGWITRSLPARLGSAGQCKATVIPSGEPVTAEKQRQELLWKQFFLDPTQWWDNRHEKRSSRNPDFRHKTTREGLWLDSKHKPVWVDAQLAAWDARLVVGTPGIVSTSTSENDDALDWRLATTLEDIKAVNWSKLCEEGELSEAVEALESLLQSDVHIDTSLLYSVIKRCIKKKDLVLGRSVHALILKCGYESNAFLANHMIGMYASHGKLEEATQVFSKVAVPNAYMWASIILAHAKHGEATQAVKLYQQMRKSTVKPDNHIFAAVLKACNAAADLASGKEVHADILANGAEVSVVVGGCLVDMYAKCGSLEDARSVFDRLPAKDVVTWTSMIAGYAQHELHDEALALYASMQEVGMTPANHVTFLCLLQACGRAGALHQGKQLHAQIQELKLDEDVTVGTCLVDMYSKCGSLEDARAVFDKLPTKNVVTWTAMIAGYAQQGLGEEALSVYAGMQKDGVFAADSFTFSCLLQACTSIKALPQGKELHAQIQEKGLEADVVVVSSLVDMYAKCGNLEEARRVFDSLPTKNVVTWTAMIAGYVHGGRGQEALALYASMQQDGLAPANYVTFVCLLQVCASLGALEQGKQLHAQIQERGMDTNTFVGGCLVDMYSKCGNIEDARRLFDRLPTKDVVTWNALINGYAENNDGQMAVQCFEEMRQQGVKPDDTTFLSLFKACSHAGLVEEGQKYFKMMDDHGIVPNVNHFACMVDLLGRSGRLDQAEDLLLSVPAKYDAVAWRSLLNACKCHGDVDRGIRCFDHLVKVEPGCASAYVLMANIYANADKWDDVYRIESLRKSAGAKKKLGKACIEIKGKLHEFVGGDERDNMLSKSKSLNLRLRAEGGHVPLTKLVLRAVPEGDKEDALCGHAEKLALAFGILNTADGTPLLVTKNLRMCQDCHNGIKIMSKLEKRKLVVRDAHRVHRFVDGSCSCGDLP